MKPTKIEMFETHILPVKNKIFRFAARLLDNPEEAQDVVQDVFVKVWGQKSHWHEVNNFEAWCMQITKNLSLDRIRKAKRRNTEQLTGVHHIAMVQLNPQEQSENKERMAQIEQIVSTLNKNQQQVIHLRDVEGYSYNEIAEIMQLDLNQVKVNLFRARSTVREKMKKLDAYGL